MIRFNIYRRRDGRYEGRLSQGKKENGRRKFQYFFGKTREIVEKRMAEALANESRPTQCSITVAEIFDEWYAHVKHRLKESTAANYRMKIQKHILPEFGEIQAGSMDSTSINQFIQKKLKSGLSPRYVSDIIVLMKSAYKFASKKHRIANPAADISLPRKCQSEIRCLDDDEQRRLVAHINTHDNTTALGIAIAMYMGLRIGELCALQWEDIDFKKRILTVRKTLQRIQCTKGKSKTKIIITSPKSGSSFRHIPIPDCVMELLIKHRGKNAEYVLSEKINPIEPRTMQYRFAKILKNEKLPSVHFHALRHMFASNCIRLGFDVKALSEILGHSNVEITLNRYVHSSLSQKMAYMRLIQPSI
ncbi:MAG: site-specific integrase [Oscillospiraceae bacterium]|nr:site-specific integrase [Oscillospiraceae bacterium]